jgi:probable HAF family extracellular repeat protein
MRTLTRDLALIFLLLTLGIFEARAVQYSIVPVSPGYGVGINNYGDIAGNNGSHAFMWTYKTRLLQTVRTLGGTVNWAGGINDCGEVVGSSELKGDKVAHAFVWYQGYVSDLDPHGLGSWASAINNAGVIVGSAVVGMESRPATFRPGKPVIIDPHGIRGVFRAISFSGVIVGSRTIKFPNGLEYSRTFMWEKGVVTQLSGLSDDVPESEDPYGINDLGDVVGTFWSHWSDGFVIYYHGSQTGVGSLSTELNNTSALAINNSGIIVGGSELHADNNQHAFLYRAGTMMEDLNNLIDPKDPLARYVTLVRAYGVNDSGWILASGTDSRSGAEGVYLLTVKDPPIQLQRLQGGCSHH